MSLFYREFGNGNREGLAVLHGLLGSGRTGTARPKNSPRFDVVTLDLRNHGSSFHAAKMDYPTMAEDVLRDPHPFGLSRGGSSDTPWEGKSR